MIVEAMQRFFYGLFLLSMMIFFSWISWDTDNLVVLFLSITGMIIIWIASHKEAARARELLRKWEEEDDKRS